MHILNRYLAKNILLSLSLAVGLATFVMVIGFFTKSIDMLSRGVPMTPLLIFVAYKTPQLLAYTIPMGLLVAVVLVFNRMSADHEITALRAGGVSILQLAAPILLLGIILSFGAARLLFVLAPDYSHRANWLIREKAVTSIAEFIPIGAYTELTDGFFVYIGDRDGSELQDIRVLRFAPNGVISEDITAVAGHIDVQVAEKKMNLTLRQAIIVSTDSDAPYDASKIQRIAVETLEYPLDYGESLNRRVLMRKYSNMTLHQLIVHIRLIGGAGGDTRRPVLELHKRAVLSLAPLTFVLIGIPLGMTVGRKENYTGLIVSLVVAVVYYGSTLLVESQNLSASMHPELLMWIPNLVCQSLGVYLLWRRR